MKVLDIIFKYNMILYILSYIDYNILIYYIMILNINIIILKYLKSITVF